MYLTPVAILHARYLGYLKYTLKRGESTARVLDRGLFKDAQPHVLNARGSSDNPQVATSDSLFPVHPRCRLLQDGGDEHFPTNAPSFKRETEREKAYWYNARKDGMRDL